MTKFPKIFFLLLGMSLAITCKQSMRSIEVLYLNKLDIEDTTKYAIDTLHNNQKTDFDVYKYYLVKGRGSNRFLTKKIFNYIKIKNDSELKSQIKKYNRVQLNFYRVTSKTNLQTIKMDPRTIQAYYNHDKVCQISWVDGKLFSIDYLVHDTYRSFLDEINK